MSNSQAVVYTRQSIDKGREAAAVARQLEACQELCDQRGWTITQVLSDNDISATTGKIRPGFEALLTSNPKRIVVWHIDRLVRLSKSLERVIALGVNVYAVKSGHVDLSNPAGRAVAKTITAWAQYEGEQKATRQVAANRQRAQQGRVLWTRRPFGFEREGPEVRVVETEGAAIRDAANTILKGGTLASVEADWNARGLTTSVGHLWCVTFARRVLSALDEHVTFQSPEGQTAGSAALPDTVRAADLAVQHRCASQERTDSCPRQRRLRH